MSMFFIAFRELSVDNTVSFNPIPQDYDDLLILISDRSDRAAGNDAILMSINGTTSTGQRLYGTGSGRASTTQPWPLNDGNTATADTFSNISIYISNYSSTNEYKSWASESVAENNATQAYQSMSAGVYSSNSAITYIDLSPETGGNFKQGSSFTLYGIRRGSDGTTTVS